MADEFKTLPDLLTYAELEKLGWPKRTVVNHMRGQGFPHPLNTPSKHNQWAKADVLAYLDKRRRDALAAAAATAARGPDKVRAADVDRALAALAERKTGVPAERIAGITYVPDAAQRAAMAAAAEQRAAQLGGWFLDRLAALNQIECLVMIAACMPQLRDDAIRNLAKFGMDVKLGDADWRQVAIHTLDKLIDEFPT